MRVLCPLFLFTLALLLYGTYSEPVKLRTPGGSSHSTAIFEPVGLALGKEPSSHVGAYKTFQLTPSTPVVTLDYGHEVAGYPIFDVKSVTQKVQIEVKYTEEFRGLNSNFSDGPFSYAVALSNTYRVETFEVTSPGSFKAYLLQGGQKWQSIRLLTSGSITFSSVGFVPSIATTDLTQIPGTFESNDADLNDIWKLGARAASVACFDAGTQKAIWEVNQTGALVRGMRPGISTEGAFFQNYTLEFDTRIEKGGVGWTVAFTLASPNKGIQLNLVGNLPDKTTFVNTNTSLTPANSIVLGYGYSLVNITTLPSYLLDTFPVPFSVKEKTWYRIKTVLSGGQYLAVSLNGTQIFNVSLTGYYIGGSSIQTKGSFGFGGWQDQLGYFKNVVVTDSVNGSTLYTNTLTSELNVLSEYGVQTNYYPTCLDGPKRDRLLWLGDFVHTIQILGASTSRLDFGKGTLQSFLDWQTPSGLLPYDQAIGYNATTGSTAFARGGGGLLTGYEVYGVILADYQILGLIAFTNYVSISNDLAFARETWPKWQLQIEWLMTQISSTSGLLSLFGAFLGPASGGSAVNCAFVQALNDAADIATAIQNQASASRYRAAASTLAANINKLLWNSKLGVYSLSTASPDDYSTAGLSFCISSGTANASQAEQFLSKLPSLRLGLGYKDSTQVNSSDPTVNISPNINGFLLSTLLSQSLNNSALKTNGTTLHLLKSLWGAMLANPETNTGASWEYVNLTGGPGLGLYTSLSHPWGGAPTYLLTEWVAGIQRAPGPEGYGYGKWIINPTVGVAMGLKSASASVVTAFGGKIAVNWHITSGNQLDVLINAPKGTQGTFEFGQVNQTFSGKNVYHITAKI